MGMVINTNLASLAAQRHLSNSRVDMETSMERLASGSRINRASDDAAGLRISNLMDLEVASLNQAVRNANDAISMMNMAEGALEEISNMLVRMKELGVQGASETNSTNELAAIADEYAALTSEINRIITNTEFNGVALLSAALDKDIHLGPNAADLMNITSTGYADAAALGTGTITTNASALTEAAAAEAALVLVDDERAAFGAFSNRLQYTVANLMTRSEATAAAASRIADADYAAESAALAKNQVLQQAGTAMLAQANASTQNVLSLLK